MALPEWVVSSTGEWRGTSRLHLSWLPEDQRIQTSESTLSLVAHGEIACVQYTWSEADAGPQAGYMVLAQGGEVSFGWSDSWHQSGEVMLLRGTPKAEGVLSAQGSYRVEGHPDWHWRIEFERSSEALILRMTNISPEGEEEWAVEAVYNR